MIRLRPFQQRLLSTAVAVELPIQHSRKQLPPVCTDPVQLKEMTSEILQAPMGSLFSYDMQVTQKDIDRHRDEAWNKADLTVQKVEFLLRGHAAGIEGTIWNRWLEQKATHDDSKPMQSLLDRIWREGQVYMTIRTQRMEELFGQEEDNEEDLEGIHKNIEELARTGTLEYDGSSSESESDSDSSSDEEDPTASYDNEFAFPGPTTAMYETVLDSLACQGRVIHASWDLLQDVLGRHNLDGGDEFNTNEFTRPSVLCFNALIRVAANQKYDAKKSDVQDRDHALLLAFQSYDALKQCKLVEANSATYCYLLQTVSKYFPPSKSRGNIAHGMWHQACTQGLVDDSVIQAYLDVNSPSNGSEFDEYIKNHLEGKTRKSVPQKWTQMSRKLRHDPKDAFY
ncbi:hypothetical protein FisN_22Hh244 [Fistulifera solaris]|uniref:Uncharacterized protein n=1 Tax=Fistulifera solaris TaxID=1519565 RepID=A0A1Z5JGQ4_FISSO|nr:hypothetical protein FisN_22Hh244 [Fistulifera solaris]|eukprot:GAX12941.1 hypothetical protein FisN_22Hh244 [Fistulifera solaris]